MKKLTQILFTGSVFLVPLVAIAQVTDFSTLYLFAGGIINKLYYLLLSIALVVFLWGLVKFIWNAGDEKTHAQGKQLMVWGVISFLVLVSLWAIVSFLVYGSLDLITDTPCFVDKNGQMVGGTNCRG
jgi:membrane protease YdiL (CAAX protease family)